MDWFEDAFGSLGKSLETLQHVSTIANTIKGSKVSNGATQPSFVASSPPTVSKGTTGMSNTTILLLILGAAAVWFFFFKK